MMGTNQQLRKMAQRCVTGHAAGWRAGPIAGYVSRSFSQSLSQHDRGRVGTSQRGRVFLARDWDWVVVDAVSSEPVSGPKLPDNADMLQGISRASGPFAAGRIA